MDGIRRGGTTVLSYQCGTRRARRVVELSWVSLDDYKVVLYRNEPDGWVAEIPAIEGCYALMSTREEALAELGQVFEMIAAEYREKGATLPIDTTEIVHA